MHLHLRGHHVIDRLPAYALVALPDAEQRQVEAHLARCPMCRAAFDRTLEAVADEARQDVSPPRSDIRAEFLARTGGLRIVPSGSDADTERVRLLPATPEAGRPTTRVAPGWSLRGLHVANPYLGPTLRAAAAMLLVLVLPIAGWLVGVRAQLDERSIIYSLMANPAAAHPLDDSDMAADVSGVLYADPNSNTAYLAASGLPPIPADRRYQVWLLTPSEDLVSAGFLTVSPNGEGDVLLRAPAPIGDYLAAVVTAEPQVGSPVPTAPRTLGGWISG